LCCTTAITKHHEHLCCSPDTLKQAESTPGVMRSTRSFLTAQSKDTASLAQKRCSWISLRNTPWYAEHAYLPVVKKSLISLAHRNNHHVVFFLRKVLHWSASPSRKIHCLRAQIAPQNTHEPSHVLSPRGCGVSRSQPLSRRQRWAIFVPASYKNMALAR
jgi:hypothetical protein